MSTNYYFISKEDLENEKKFLKFIEKLNLTIEKKCSDFTKSVQDGRFEDIFYDFQKEIENKLKHAYEPELIHICKTSSGTIKFEISNYFGNIKELEQFYIENKNNYIIQDEYGRKFTFNSFLNQIGYDEKENYKWINHCFS